MINSDNLKIKEANSFWSKFVGLMFKKNIDYALLLKNTNGIHTFFMKENIDVILLDKDMNVIKEIKNVKPWRVVLPIKGVKHTLEKPCKKEKSFTIKQNLSDY